MNIFKAIEKHKTDLALVIGNGINQFNAKESNSWGQIIHELAQNNGLPIVNTKAGDLKGLELTELYDLVDLANFGVKNGQSLREQICELMKSWEPGDQHRLIISWAKRTQVPVITTNFDETLSRAGNCSLFPEKVEKGFTAYYPWERYYSDKPLYGPDSAFGIWHVNGMIKYPQSIRLGLSHYMGAVERARNWIHKGEEDSLFRGKNRRNWRGVNSWLHIVFNRALVFIGLSLNSNEVFLRWLLIERAKYFKFLDKNFHQYQKRQNKAWYFYAKEGERYADEHETNGKFFFLKQVGVEPVLADKFEDLYEDQFWKK